MSKTRLGILRGRSTLQQLLLFYNIFTDLQTNSQVNVVYINVTKAFDSVPHNKPLLNLRNVGVSGNLWLW